jgi:hypothetical protein
MRLELPTRERSGPLHSSPIRNCSGWGLASRSVARPLVRSYRTFSPLPVTTHARPIGGVVSVPLSVGLPRLGVSKHPALWSSDFPRRRKDAAAVQPTYREIIPGKATGCRLPATGFPSPSTSRSRPPCSSCNTAAADRSPGSPCWYRASAR